MLVNLSIVLLLRLLLLYQPLNACKHVHDYVVAYRFARYLLTIVTFLHEYLLCLMSRHFQSVPSLLGIEKSINFCLINNVTLFYGLARLYAELLEVQLLYKQDATVAFSAYHATLYVKR